MNALTVNPHGSGTIASPIGLTQGSREKKPHKKKQKEAVDEICSSHQTTLIFSAAWWDKLLGKGVKSCQGVIRTLSRKVEKTTRFASKSGDRFISSGGVMVHPLVVKQGKHKHGL